MLETLTADAVLGNAMKLASGLIGKSSQDEANALQREIADRNYAMQHEFAKNAISWKVQDAKQAGIHPLYALGANTVSFSPVSVGVSGNDPLASALGDMGQDISRAAMANSGQKDRVNAVGKVVAGQEITANKLKLENMQLQNDLLRSKLSVVNQPATPPGVEFPVPENKKIEERPPLMLFGKRWDTNPNTSPMKAWEDQYGDEGPVSWIMPMVIGANDARHNYAKSRFGRWMGEMQRSIMQRAEQFK